MHFAASRICFAVTMIAIGIIGLATGTFAPIWAGVPKTLPDRQFLAYLCTFVSLACGIALVPKRTAAAAALFLLVYLALWTVLFKVPFIIRAPLVEVSYQSTGENLVLVAAAWVLFAMLAKQRSFPSGTSGIRTARVLYGLALIAFGFSHFAYLNLTAPLVPAWLPPPTFWAYLTGVIYLLTGAALVTGLAARAAAVLAAVQIALITFLVWGPVVLRGHVGAGDFQETVVSWALTAGAWVMAASFDGQPWLRRSARAPVAGPDNVAVEGA
jgi:uncharacterized membrane protein YphA (DoxX/SURF4 family)